MRAQPRALLLGALLCVLGGAVAPAAVAADVTTDRLIQFYQQRLARRPRDAQAYYRLGDAYVRKARESGDPTYFILAERALDRALAIAPRYAGAARHRAYVLYSRHAFEESAAQASKAIELDPADSRAYGILGDASQEVGKYAEAQAAYRKMIALEPTLDSYCRLAGSQSLHGDTDGAIASLRLAIREGQVNGRLRESIAWAQWQLGSDHFARGELRRAEARYQDALVTYPNYYRARAGLAQVRAAQGRYAEAIELYTQAISVIPMPEYVAALGDVYEVVGRHADARKQYDLVEYIGYLNTLNRVLYNRELAYFYADHDIKLAASLDLARREVEYRRDIYAYDVLAWALYKNGRLPEARAAIAEALKLGTKDARLFFHAGMIHHGLGDLDRAQEYLRRALATNRYFHITQAATAARTLAQLARPRGHDARAGS